MAACGSLQHIFKNPLPENPTLLESLSSTWNHQIKSTKPIEDSSSFTEIFGELHFKENPDSPFPIPPSSSTTNEKITKNPSSDFFSTITRKQYHKNSDISSYSSMNSESLQLCTEGLGFESSADVEELKSDMKITDWESQKEKISIMKQNLDENLVAGELVKRGRKSGGEFPPPISCIGESGKPWVSFKSYRQNGRFVLKEIRIPNQEFLHASREDGRLKLQFFQADEETGEEEEEEEEESDDVDDDNYDDDDGEGDGIVGEEEEEEEDAENDALMTSNSY